MVVEVAGLLPPANSAVASASASVFVGAAQVLCWGFSWWWCAVPECRTRTIVRACLPSLLSSGRTCLYSTVQQLIALALCAGTIRGGQGRSKGGQL